MSRLPQSSPRPHLGSAPSARTGDGEVGRARPRTPMAICSRMQIASSSSPLRGAFGPAACSCSRASGRQPLPGRARHARHGSPGLLRNYPSARRTQRSVPDPGADRGSCRFMGCCRPSNGPTDAPRSPIDCPRKARDLFSASAQPLMMTYRHPILRWFPPSAHTGAMVRAAGEPSPESISAHGSGETACRSRARYL